MNRIASLAPLVALGLALASAPAAAQAINIDVNNLYGTPSSSFGGAASQPGVWNSVLPTVGSAPLVDIGGNATGATITAAGMAASYSFDNLGTTGDDQALMDDLSDPSPNGATWTISGLASGNYVLVTYAWAPDNMLFISNVSVAGSSDAAQTVGGAWPGGYQLGATHALHHVSVPPGGPIVMSIVAAGGGSFASLNGFQVTPDSSGTAIDLCQPGLGGVIPCPCGNPPANSPRGCNNSSATGGARLVSTGSPSLGADTVVFVTDGQRPTATSIVLQGGSPSANGLVFGQGVRCAAGTIKRLYVKAASGGSVTAPQMGDPSVSARSAAVGDPIAPGTSRYYGVYYRDPTILGGCPAVNTFNVTQTQQIDWVP
jgi:hypothetical protein